MEDFQDWSHSSSQCCRPERRQARLQSIVLAQHQEALILGRQRLGCIFVLPARHR